MRVGIDPRRTDQLYNRLPHGLAYFKKEGDELVKVNDLLKTANQMLKYF